MDRRERIGDPLISHQSQIDGSIGQIWTALPGILQSYDATKLTCSVQPAIQAQLRDATGKWSNVTISICLDVPVMFSRGGGYGCTLPLQKGDEGLIVFASRCIDAWWQNGGVQPQAELRMHDLSDGFFFPGGGSQAKLPATNPSTATAKFWSEDGLQYVEIDKTTGKVNVVASQQINLTAPTITFNGAIVMNGSASGQIGGGGIVDFGTTQIKSNGKRIDSVHTHSDPQGGNTGPVN